MSSIIKNENEDVNILQSKIDYDAKLNALIKKCSKKKRCRPNIGFSSKVNYSNAISPMIYEVVLYSQSSYMMSTVFSNDIPLGYFLLLDDINNEYSPHVFSTMADARKVFEGFIESNLLNVRSEKSKRHLIKFIRVLHDLPKKGAKMASTILCGDDAS